MRMNSKSSSFITHLSGLICGVLALATVNLHAAKEPMSKEALEKEAHFIISGKVMALISKVQKSKVERARKSLLKLGSPQPVFHPYPVFKGTGGSPRRGTR